MFSSMVDSKYKGAADKAQEAFLIQSGIEADVNLAKNAVAKVAAKAIDNKPFKSKDVIFVAGVSYALIVKKQVVQKFKNPVFPAVTHVVTVGKGIGSLGLALPF